MKDEGLENKGAKKDNGFMMDGNNSNVNTGRDIITGKNLNDTGLSSTFKSLDLPPKEYEQQLQQYEAEVRNHIKTEQ